ncbi:MULTISPECIES: type II secretion system protein [unclassified Cryobacterium]|uniref:type IV pilus modification PilV family protein n=1 Tax=unclassified Cryobacterium TaxID=2649013 RepID=UPI00106BAD05|nr:MULTISPECIES: type II secretion system protein [unclassified Cryobacterium]TFB98384.1 type II secretion system protein [Cryobacterium sp. MDB2-A-1]TFC08266.1 type II secretion system protein [Cryobacterium sp. MDB2-33-2]TFC08533.1 type II secretion system protein [Cryobacterium sp. MDB2-A-2]TFC21934.1 type II secretion system protein [Cryobacterium sp. MDB2-10]
MMIFSMIALGVGYAMVTTLALSRDSKLRETASSIASTEIDAARALGNPFAVLDVSAHTITTAGSENYIVTRTTAWVTPAGAASTCGTGGGALQYKRITVTVSWPNIRPSSRPVVVDTLLAPSARINDPTKGTLLISVKNARGLGQSGVTFTAISALGSVTTTPTDADGCAFVLQAAPGDYAVKLTTTGMIDSTQVANPVLTRTVAAGTSASYSFQYDTAVRFTLNYASNIVAPLPKIPIDLDYTFINSLGNWALKATSNHVDLHPYTVGYQTFAGKFAATGCPSPDPEAWAPDTRVTPALVAVRGAIAAPAPGVPVTVNVPMGGVTVTSGTAGWLTAVSDPATPVPGEPSCLTSATTTMTYNFGNIVPSSGAVRISLPFGSWRLFTSTSSGGALTQLPQTRATLLTHGLAPDATGLFVLDPR